MRDDQHDSFHLVAEIERTYLHLLHTGHPDPNRCLGGQFLYAGDLDPFGKTFTIAANIAGAATLAVCGDRDAQKNAMREGVVDFVVTNLDEALRILKNELRKQETVAVCVGQTPHEVEQEMAERGVVPDLHRHALELAAARPVRDLATYPDDESDFAGTPALITWRTKSSLPNDLARLDAFALDLLPHDAWRERRWLRLSPRYLGRAANGIRLLSTTREFTAQFVEKLQSVSAGGSFDFAFEVHTQFRGLRDEFHFAPDAP